MQRIVLAFAILVAFATVGHAKPKVSVTTTEIVLATPVYFDSGKDTIKSESHAILDQVASTLAKTKRIALVEIQVHTDARGNDDWNLKLSQQRADAIQAYLIGKGVDATRLRARGYGETQPIDKGTSASAMAKNRRTTFKILQRTTA